MIRAVVFVKDGAGLTGCLHYVIKIFHELMSLMHQGCEVVEIQLMNAYPICTAASVANAR